MTTEYRYDAIIIGGYGHVGLPLGIALANEGFQVGLYDIDKSWEKLILEGKMPFLEYDAEPILERVVGSSLHLVPNLSAVAQGKSIIVTIGTPLDEYMNPKVLPILNLAEEMFPYLNGDHHLILRSTVFPGTSKRLYDYFTDRGTFLHLSFCPERIAQGYAIRELRKLPQIISGFTKTAIERSEIMFQKLGVKTVIVSITEAELAKLFSNAWRYIQFALANQFYMIAVENDASFEQIHTAMTYGYNRAGGFPGAGFSAGPCLLKDTMQLSAFYQNNFLLGHSAMLINEGLPSFIVNQIRKKFDLQKEVIGILGMAFKADVDDIRDSLSYKLGKLLRFYGAKVLYSDEYASDPTFISKEELIAKSSIVILGVPHRAYSQLHIPTQVHLVDVWGFFRIG